MKMFWIALLVLPSFAFAQDAVVATATDTQITTKELSTLITRLGPKSASIAGNVDLRRRFLDHIINTRLLAKEARKSGLQNDAEFKSRLRDIENELLYNFYLERFIEQHTQPQDVERYFATHKALFVKRQVWVKHLVYADESKAQDIRKSLASLPSRNALEAKLDELSKDNDLGFIGRKAMPETFEEVAFTTPVGSIADKLAKTQFGYHVIFVKDQRGDDNVMLTEVEDNVKRALRDDVETRLIDDMRKKANVAIREDALVKMQRN